MAVQMEWGIEAGFHAGSVEGGESINRTFSPSILDNRHTICNDSEKGTVPFFLADSEESGQSPQSERPTLI